MNAAVRLLVVRGCSSIIRRYQLKNPFRMGTDEDIAAAAAAAAAAIEAAEEEKAETAKEAEAAAEEAEPMGELKNEEEGAGSDRREHDDSPESLGLKERRCDRANLLPRGLGRSQRQPEGGGGRR